MRGLIRILLTAAAVSLLPAGRAAAQLPIPTRPGEQQRPDSAQIADTVKVPPFRVEPPIPPLAAFGRSLLLPGWGQATMGRRVTGAFFVFWEGLTLTMTLKASHQLGYLESIGADEERLSAKRQEIQDWAVLLIFNHLLAGAEAFVSAYLWDFPVELEQRALPADRVGLGARVSF